MFRSDPPALSLGFGCRGGLDLTASDLISLSLSACAARGLAGVGAGGALQRPQRAAGGHHAVQEAALHR